MRGNRHNSGIKVEILQKKKKKHTTKYKTQLHHFFKQFDETGSYLNRDNIFLLFIFEQAL